jgi:hypothetical protein
MPQCFEECLDKSLSSNEIRETIYKPEKITVFWDVAPCSLEES